MSTNKEKNMNNNSNNSNNSSNSDNSNNSNNSNNNSNSKPKKKSKTIRQKLRENRQKIVKGTKKKFQQLKEKAKQQLLGEKEFYRTGDKGLVSAEEYAKLIEKEEALKKEQKVIAKQEGIIYNNNGDITYPALELDAFLSANRKRLQNEFIKLQEKEGFYFTKGLEDKELQELKLNEGMHFIGVNINALFDLFGLNLKEQGLEDIKGDILSQGRSYELIGEHINSSDKMNEIMRDKMGFRMGNDKQFIPEKVLNEFSSFENIVTEAKNYNIGNKIKLTPQSLYKMIKILHKYKKSENQWLRSATALEIIYQYLSSGMTREEFFKLNTNINPEGIYELDEFFKTDHLFMTPDELKLYKQTLDFYKYNPEIDTFMNSNNTISKKLQSTNNTNISDEELTNLLNNNSI